MELVYAWTGIKEDKIVRIVKSAVSVISFLILKPRLVINQQNLK
jgi:hypothetical protein